MEDKTLMQIAIFCSISGLIVLFILMKNAEIGNLEVSKLNENYIDREFNVKGKIEAIRTTGKVTIMEILQESQVKVVVFENISLKQGTYIQARGTVTDYEGDYEIIADEIRVIG